MASKISVVIDATVDKAVSGLKGFRQSINDADGAVGKFKAGASSAFESVKGAAAGLALGAGAALVAFGVKAVAAFQDTALAAGHLADASGLTIDAASRWIAVGDDIGVSAETIQKSFGKMAKEIGTGGVLLDKYGISVVKGANGQADMNATMLHAIDVMRSIQDPAKKAELAQQLLGRGWQDMAELIEQGSKTLTDSMAEVSDAQVIDQDEVNKARKMRESLDNLQDAVSDVSVALGEELVPMLAAWADGLAKVIGPLSEVNKWSKDVAMSVFELTGLIDKQKEAIDPLIFGYGKMATSLDSYGGAGHKVVEMQEGLKTVQEETAETTEDLIAANEELARRIKEVEDRYRDLKGELSDEEAFHNAEGMWRDLATSAEDAYIAAANGAEDAEQKAFDHAGVIIYAKQQVVELGEKYTDLPAEKITNIVALIDEGKLAEAEAAFNNLARNRTMSIDIISKGGAGFGVGQFATGGDVPGPRGQPQLAVVHGGEHVQTAAEVDAERRGAGNGFGGGGVTFNLYSSGLPTVADLAHVITLARLSR